MSGKVSGMARAHRSRKAEIAARSRELRRQGWSWRQIAAQIAQQERVNARVAFRLAHGLSQQAVADRWNELFLGEDGEKPLTGKQISYWETWPQSGREPSLTALDRLARIYQCDVKDLLDSTDYGQPNPADQSCPAPAPLSAVAPGHPIAVSDNPTLVREPWHQVTATKILSPSLMDQLPEMDLLQLSQVILMWAHQLPPGLSRRALLSKLSTAFALAAAAPIFDISDPDEQRRVALVLEDSSQLDAATLAHAEKIVLCCRHQGDVLGPRIALQTALGQHQVVQRLVDGAPDHLKPRALSIYAELSQLIGWQLFNLGDYRGAQYYYEDACTAAHDAENEDLVIYVLCAMSHLATWQGKPRVGIDHAIAAQSWAEQAGNPRAQSYAADVAARAYAATNQADKCHAALDREYAALKAIQADEPAPSWWYFYDESFYWATVSGCALKLGQPDLALEAVTKSLGIFDPSNLHNYAFTLLFRGEAYIQHGELTEATRIIGDVASLTTVNTAQRIDQRIDEVRGLLAPWEKTRPVQELDERLAVYRSGRR